MKQFQEPGCCRQGDMYVYWYLKGKRGKYTVDPSPEKTGWTMSVDDSWEVNINFCPFCGKKLDG